MGRDLQDCRLGRVPDGTRNGDVSSSQPLTRSPLTRLKSPEGFSRAALLAVAGALSVAITVAFVIFAKRPTARTPTRNDLVHLRTLFWTAKEAGEKDPESSVREQITREQPGQDRLWLDLFSTYLSYQERAQLLGGLPLKERFEALKKLRREVFGERMAGLLFSEEERTAEFVLKRAEILRDRALSEEEKRARSDRLKRDILGEEEEDSPSEWFQYYEKASREIRTNPELSAEEKSDLLKSMREGLFGAEAAERLAKVENEQEERSKRESALWDSLDASYAEEGLSPDELKARVDSLQGEVSAEEWDRLLRRYELRRSSVPPSGSSRFK